MSTRFVTESAVTCQFADAHGRSEARYREVGRDEFEGETQSHIIRGKQEHAQLKELRFYWASRVQEASAMFYPQIFV